MHHWMPTAPGYPWNGGLSSPPELGSFSSIGRQLKRPIAIIRRYARLATSCF